jgi:hypothetical protein
MDPVGNSELAFFHHLSGSIRDAVYHLCVWRYRELGENPIRANATGQPIFGPGTHTAAEWFNPAAFAAPAAFTYGNVGRNSMTGPPLQTMDLALGRTFRLTENANFQFRAEAFNALNKVNLGTPNRYVNEPQFGTITMAMTPGREIQLSARISF